MGELLRKWGFGEETIEYFAGKYIVIYLFFYFVRCVRGQY